MTDPNEGEAFTTEMMEVILDLQNGYMGEILQKSILLPFLIPASFENALQIPDGAPVGWIVVYYRPDTGTMVSNAVTECGGSDLGLSIFLGHALVQPLLEINNVRIGRKSGDIHVLVINAETREGYFMPEVVVRNFFDIVHEIHRLKNNIALPTPDEIQAEIERSKTEAAEIVAEMQSGKLVPVTEAEIDEFRHNAEVAANTLRKDLNALYAEKFGSLPKIIGGKGSALKH
jgi:hypothetical protein